MMGGIIGIIQVIEVIKYLFGIGEFLIGYILIYNVLKMDFRKVKINKRESCEVCGENLIIKELIDYEQF